MKTKPLTFLLALTFLFLFSGSSVVFADDFQDGLDAYKRQDYKTAYKLFLPLAEQGNASAQFNLGLMYYKGQVAGLDGNRRYSVRFDVEIATNVPNGCFGVGGAPGEAVTL